MNLPVFPSFLATLFASLGPALHPAQDVAPGKETELTSDLVDRNGGGEGGRAAARLEERLRALLDPHAERSEIMPTEQARGGANASPISPPSPPLGMHVEPIDRWVDESGDKMTGKLTLSPAGDQALDVASGSVYKAGALFLHSKGGANNTGLGAEALSSVTTGFENTALGSRALYRNTTGTANTASGSGALYSNTTGGANTAHGFVALYSTTTGIRNTATGYGAMALNDTGSENTANGQRALLLNTTGSYNTAVGGSALSSNSAGNSNTAIGCEALRSNTIGEYNVAVGHQALDSNTMGSYNTATGNDALSLNTTGYFNTAMGSVALRNNTTGCSNTATGNGALVRNTTGSGNTAVGAGALYFNLPGHRNTAIGFRALETTTGNDNIAIGSYAGCQIVAGSDNVAIANTGYAGDSGTIRLGVDPLHARTFIAGIHGAITDVPNAISVLVDSQGQLGTISSSRRFKQEIEDMGESTERLLDLRPVVFRYRRHAEAPGGEAPLEYGLIAEEVAEVFPELVVRDEEGRPFTVKYQLLSSMLLNELQELHARVAELEARQASAREGPPGGHDLAGENRRGGG